MAQRGNLLRPLIRFAPNFSGSGQTAFGPGAASQLSAPLQSLSNVEWSVKSGHAKSITFKRDGGQTRVSSLARSAAETYTQRRLFEAL